jgi:membrane protein insertase Oxa1/YidC/SpoIIIJ
MGTMVYMFPALTFFIGLSLPSALPLYWATASLVAILQQYLVLQRDVRELEDGTPTPAITSNTNPGSSKAKPKHKAKGKKKG